MSDYIEREAALAVCQKEYEERLSMADWCGDTVAWNIGSAIKNMPAADVEPVVHCKDCRYLEFSDFYGECGRSYFGIVQPWDYCSRGARRNKEDNT